GWQVDRRVRGEAREADRTRHVRSDRSERHRELRSRAEAEDAARRLRLELEDAEAVVGQEPLGLPVVSHPAQLALQAEDAARVEAERAHAVEAEAVEHVVAELSQRLTIDAGEADGVSSLRVRGERREQERQCGDDP